MLISSLKYSPKMFRLCASLDWSRPTFDYNFEGGKIWTSWKGTPKNL